MNKRGGVGNLIVMFFAIIAIVVILTVFAFSNGILKKLYEEPAGDVAFGEDGTEQSFFNYTERDSGFLSEVRFAVGKGKDVDVAIAEVGYDA